MISDPKHGWCDFTLGDFTGTPSYLTNVPVDLLDMFLSFRRNGNGSCFFDEEGSMFTFVVNPYSIFVIEERSEPILHDFSEMNIDVLEKELINDIEKDLDAWAIHFTFNEEEAEETKKMMKNKIRELNRRSKRRGVALKNGK